MNFEEDVEKPKASSLEVISNKVAEAKKLEQRISEGEGILSELKRQKDYIYRRDIPDLMAQFGLTDITTDTGFKVSVKHKVTASVSKAKMDDACAWLREHGHGNIIKNELIVSFKVGKEKEALELRNTLKEGGFEVIQKRSIHAQTLSALVRELKEDKKEVPEELLGVYEFDEAKVKA